MQTDDTLGLSDVHFADLEQEELVKAFFTAKLKEELLKGNDLQFNSCILLLNPDGLMHLR